MPTLVHVLVVAAVVFSIALFGLLARKNLLASVVCAEIMLSSVALVLVAFDRYWATATGAIEAEPGRLFALFVAVIGVAQVSVGLGLVFGMVRNRGSLRSDDANLLRG